MSDVWEQDWVQKVVRPSDPDLDVVVGKHVDVADWVEAKALEPEYRSVFASRVPDGVQDVTAYSDGSIYVAMRTEDGARSVMRALSASGFACRAVHDPDGEGVGVWGRRQEDGR